VRVGDVLDRFPFLVTRWARRGSGVKDGCAGDEENDEEAHPHGWLLRASLTEPINTLKTVLLRRVYGSTKKASIRARIRGPAHNFFYVAHSRGAATNISTGRGSLRVEAAVTQHTTAYVVYKLLI
jgi:hypothetical protein